LEGIRPRDDILVSLGREGQNKTKQNKTKSEAQIKKFKPVGRMKRIPEEDRRRVGPRNKKHHGPFKAFV
jgi:hypothetical protein